MYDLFEKNLKDSVKLTNSSQVVNFVNKMIIKAPRLLTDKKEKILFRFSLLFGSDFDQLALDSKIDISSYGKSNIQRSFTALSFVSNSTDIIERTFYKYPRLLTIPLSHFECEFLLNLRVTYYRLNDKCLLN